VDVTYQLGDVVDKIIVNGTDYHEAKEQAERQIPEGAMKLNIRVNREV